MALTPSKYSVLVTTHDEPCFVCDKQSNYFVVEVDNYLCMDCISTLAAVEVIATRKSRVLNVNIPIERG